MTLKNCVKKLFLLVTVLFLAVALVACDPTEKVSDEQKVSEGLTSIIFDAPIDSLTGSFEVPNTTIRHELEIVWTVEPLKSYPTEDGKPVGAAVGEKGADKTQIVITPDPFQISADGTPLIGDWRGATLKATVTSGEVSDSRTWELYIKAEAEKYNVEDLLGLPKGTSARLEGTVIYITAGTYRNFYVMDENGDIMYCYATAPEGVNVGDKVSVAGTYTVYYQQPEFDNDTTTTVIEKGNGTFDLATVTKTMSVVEINALDNKDLKNHNFPVLTEGYIVENPTMGSGTDASCTYGLRDIYGNVLAFYKPADDELTQLAGFVGKYVQLTIFLNDVHSTYKFWRNNAVVSTIQTKDAPVVTDASKVETIEKELTGSFEGITVVADLTLPTTNSLFTDATIAWTSSDASVIDNNGKLVAQPSEDITITLTAKITCGSATKDVAITVTVTGSFTKTNIADTYALCAENKQIWVEGVIIAQDNAGYPYIADGTGIIYVRTKLTEGIALGDSVKVVGAGTVYKGSGNKQYTVQVGSAVYTKLDTPVTPLDTQVVPIEELNNITVETGDANAITDNGIAAITGSKYFGKLVTITGYVQQRLNGTNTNLYLATSTEADAPAVVYYWSNSDASEEALTAEVGNLVTIVCPIYDYSSDYGWRLGTYTSMQVGGELPSVLEVSSIADVHAVADDTEVKVQGTVTYTYDKRGFYVQDATASIYVYANTEFDVVIGDTVTVTGKKGTYNGPQIASPEWTKGAKVEYTPSGEEMTLADVKALLPGTATYGKVVKVKFTPVKSGNYINANAGDLTLQLYNDDAATAVLNNFLDQEVEAYIMLYAYFARNTTWNIFVFEDTIKAVATE